MVKNALLNKAGQKKEVRAEVVEIEEWLQQGLMRMVEHGKQGFWWIKKGIYEINEKYCFEGSERKIGVDV